MNATKEEQFLQGIALILIQEKLIDKAKLLVYQNLAEKQGISLVKYLVANNIFQADKIASLFAKHFDLPLIDLDSHALSSLPLYILDKRLIYKYQVLPLYIQNSYLFLAIDDPSKQELLKEIQFHTGLELKILMVETTKLEHFINKMQMDSDEDAPIIELVSNIIDEAVTKGVSDIHFEPYENTYRVRYRKDGLLYEVKNIAKELALQITSRIKILANLDIAERRLPQDGRFQSQVRDFRVSTCPLSTGEKVVIRILDNKSTRLDIESLGLSNLQKQLILNIIHKPQGLIIVTGPTGSGKTITLYTLLNILNTQEVNISTAEDPVEIKIDGINQVNINPKTGLTFSESLRALLRQDPDIMMVGEIRDLETAEIAIKAAQTGHLVLTSLHTNSAAKTLSRLSNMGIANFNIVSSLSLVIAQRLMRKLCDACKILRDDLTTDLIEKLGLDKKDGKLLQIYKAEGCQLCTNGYHGRIAVFEVMHISKTIAELIMSNTNSYDLLQQAQKEGMLTIYQSGLEALCKGLTSIEEIHRVLVE